MQIVFLANMIIMTCLISALQRYKFSLKQMSKCLDYFCIYNNLTFLAAFRNYSAGIILNTKTRRYKVFFR